MKSWFENTPQRRGSNSVKWDERPDVLPLWIADMDFPAAPCIREALQRKLDHGVFGYTRIPDSYYEAVIRWFGERHGWTIARESIIPIEGIIAATSIALKALTNPGDKVIMQTPAYNCFFSCIRNTGCELLANPLGYEASTGHYSLDFEHFERCCEDPQAKVFLLCNPHNPSGRLWTKEELLRLWEICHRHGIPVISDEIHCDIVPPGSAYTPFASLSDEIADHCISFASPSKPFNIAGLGVANMICANETTRKKLDRVLNDWEHCDLNQFAPVALEAAYSPEGAVWLDEMNAYVHDNFRYLKERFAAEAPSCVVTPLEATYLAWVRIDALGVTGTELEDFLLEKEKVWINCGAMYGDDHFVRINLACPRTTLQQALDRILQGIRKLSR